MEEKNIRLLNIYWAFSCVLGILLGLWDIEVKMNKILCFYGVYILMMVIGEKWVKCVVLEEKLK